MFLAKVWLLISSIYGYYCPYQLVFLHWIPPDLVVCVLLYSIVQAIWE